MQDLYADIIVDISHEKLDKIFQFRIPEALQDELKVGMVAEFPFGAGNRLTKGFVVGIGTECDYDKTKVKSLIRIAQKEIGVESEFILLAEYISKNYGSTMLQALKTVVPVKQKVQAVEDCLLILKLDLGQAESLLKTYQSKNYKAKVRLLQELLKAPGYTLRKSSVVKEKTATSAVIKAFEQAGVIRLEKERNYRNPNASIKLHHIAENRKIGLTKAQQACADEIWQESHSFYSPKAHLIHGVTGSGKTVVYMELIRRVISEGRQAIVLIPEIALTFQTVERFREMFGDRVSFLHSRLSKGERFDQMERAMSGEIDIMVGPRSALFTPFKRLGIIVLDEEHEQSYKSETMPRYHAREVAIERAKINHGFVVLGSATPSLESYYKAKCGEYKLYKLKERYAKRNMAAVEIVDLREELRQGNRSILSRRLREQMAECLAKKEQMMLFINRRGFAGFVSCRSCGEVVKCPHCDVSLSLHNNGKMVCHYCGYEISAVKLCPSCNSKYIGAFKAGTQQIEEIVKREFPGARVLRMDMDTTRNKEGHGKILSAFAKGEADILVGTQMIVKGHDFPRVTLVAALAADMSLYANDYHGAERTFQLLTQAAGRAGRGEREGVMIIQTYTPDNYSIVTAAEQNYESFYEQEMNYRSIMNYPPAKNLLAILMSSLEEEKLDIFSKEIKEKIMEQTVENMAVIGPAQAAVFKIQDYYRKVIYIKHENYDILTKVKDNIENFVKEHMKNQECYIQFDFNPINIY